MGGVHLHRCGDSLRHRPALSRPKLVDHRNGRGAGSIRRLPTVARLGKQHAHNILLLPPQKKKLKSLFPTAIRSQAVDPVAGHHTLDGGGARGRARRDRHAARRVAGHTVDGPPVRHVPPVVVHILQSHHAR